MALKYNNDEYLKKLSVYFKNFTEEQLREYEEEIFGEKIDRKKRVELELGRIKLELSNNMKNYVYYYSEIADINRLLKVADLSTDILDEIYRRIVMIQLSAGINIRLYSAFSLIKTEQETLELKKKVGELHDGPKLNK